MSVITPKDCFHQPQVADLRLIACPGAEELTNLIDKHLVRWASEAGYQLYHRERLPPLPERRRQGSGQGVGARRRYFHRC